MNVLPEAALAMGAPGLAFETWETSIPNRFVHQDRCLARFVRQTESKDLRLLFVYRFPFTSGAETAFPSGT